MSQSLLMKELSYPTSMPIPLLSVVMPCFNEQGQIEDLLKDWSRAIEEKSASYELIVINDGSLDGTSRVLDRLRREIKNLRIVHQLNTGHGKAVQRGYELARGEWVLQLDSSGRFEPSDLESFWNEREGKDLLVANRTHRLDSFVRRVSVHLLVEIIEFLFKIQVPDPDASFRLFRRVPVLEKMKKLPAAVRGVNLAMTILLKKTVPDRVADIKVPYRVRALIKGRIGVMASLGLFKAEVGELLKLRYLLKSLWA